MTKPFDPFKPMSRCKNCGMLNLGHCHFCEIIGIAAETMAEAHRIDEERRRELIERWRRGQK